MARHKRLMGFGQIRVNADSVELFDMVSECMSTKERNCAAIDAAIEKLEAEKLRIMNVPIVPVVHENEILFRKFN